MATALLVQRAINVVFGAALVAAGGRRMSRLGLRDLPLLIFVGLADVAANGVYALASQSGLVSVVAAVASLYPVVTVLLARQLLGERLRTIQRAGTGAALGGVVCCSWLTGRLEQPCVEDGTCGGVPRAPFPPSALAAGPAD